MCVCNLTLDLMDYVFKRELKFILTIIKLLSWDGGYGSFTHGCNSVQQIMTNNLK